MALIDIVTGVEINATRTATPVEQQLRYLAGLRAELGFAKAHSTPEHVKQIEVEIKRQTTELPAGVRLPGDKQETAA